MRRTSISLWFMIGMSFLIGFVFSVYPLSFELQWWRPEFILLLVIYWVYTLHSDISLLFLCALGLFQDVLESVPIGQHGLSVILVAYLCLLSQQRMRTFSMLRQTGWVFVLVGVAQLTDNWVQGMAGRELSGLNFLYPAVVSALLWPVLKWGLDRIAHRYRISGD
jgi:rod shape-determining protein MreD